MSKASIVILCIFCLVMSGVIIGGGYLTWDAYRQAHTSEEIGNDLLNGIDDKVQDISDVAQSMSNRDYFWNKLGEKFSALGDRIRDFFTDLRDSISGFFTNLGDDIRSYFTTMWNNLRAWFKRAFGWIKNDDYDDSGTSYPGGGDGFGGGGGGARG